MTKKNSLFHSYMENLMVKVGTQLEQVGADPEPGDSEEHEPKKSSDVIDGQTVRRTNGRTDEQTVRRTNGRTDEQTVRRTNGRTDEQMDGHVDRQMDGHVDRQMDGHLSDLKYDQVTGQLTGHLNEHYPLPTQPLSQRPFAWLTPNQEKVLHFLINNQGQVLRLRDIEKYAEVPYGSVRRVLRYLKAEGYITHMQRVIKGRQRGLSCRLNQSLSGQFIASINCGHLDGRQNDHLTGHLTERTLERTDERTLPLSSSSFLNTTTTKSENCGEMTSPPLARTSLPVLDAIAEALATHPELGYWRQKKLSPQQVHKWMEMTGSSLENLIQSLCHCRFEMVEMDMEKEKDIKNVFNWFFRIIERAGFYPKPKDYKSYLERQLEIEKKLLAEKQERLKVLAELQQQKKEAERSLAFYEMLNQPDSELYQQCFSRLDKFTQTTKNTSLFERFMRDAFDQIMDGREQQLLAEARQGGDGKPGGGDGRGF